jgi:uncharacterized membrane protein YtjA (UPF0391 family)
LLLRKTLCRDTQHVESKAQGVSAAAGMRHASSREAASFSAAAENFPNLRSEVVMLYYAIVFFVIALIAALFGFGGIAAGAAGIAKILFFAFLIIAIVTFLMSLARRS